MQDVIDAKIGSYFRRLMFLFSAIIMYGATLLPHPHAFSLRIYEQSQVKPLCSWYQRLRFDFRLKCLCYIAKICSKQIKAIELGNVENV